MAQKTRLEHDFLGEKEIPADTYYGIQTCRALENFSCSGQPISTFPAFIRALAWIKKAAARANARLGVIPENIAEAICTACDEIIAGKHLDQFPVDAIQGGAGTSTNMNANEVIANRALEIMGHAKGEYEYCHPNNHVNCSQSTNDAYPSSLRLALYVKIGALMDDIRYLQEGFDRKGDEFAHVIKMGRTQLQDAVPMTLGMEFHAYANTLGEEIARLDEARKLALEINMGATAIGTGICSPSGYAETVIKELQKVSGLPVKASANLVEATWDTGCYVQISGALKRAATKISKICNDLRLLSSGPRTGINEINLPKRQPGSSIMPGKVNPVMPEMVNQICFDIMGKDVTIAIASESGQLELNVMEPIMALCLFTGITRLGKGVRALQDLCVAGITANEERCRELVQHSIGIVTALLPYIGYEKAAAIAKEALATEKSVLELAEHQNLLDRKQIEKILSPENMLQPGEEKVERAR